MKKIDKSREELNKRLYKKAMSHIKAHLATQGIDYDTGNYLNERGRDDNFLDHYSDYLDEELEIAEDATKVLEENKEKSIRTEEELNKELEERTKVIAEETKKRIENEYTMKHRKFKIFAISAGLTLALVGTAITAYFVGKRQKEKDIIESKTNSYTSELQDVIDGATRNVGQYIMVDYAQIAKYIKNSDNPDLALYTLYREFGTRVKEPKYDHITNSTCNYLYFEDEEGKEVRGDFCDYASGFNRGNQTDDEIYERYNTDCERELLKEDDSILDNLKYKVRKMTK